MEVSISPFSLPLDFAANSRTSVEPVPIAPVQDPTPKGESPSTIVTIKPAAEPPPVYSEPAVIATYLRDNSYTSKAAVATSQAMVQSVNQLSSGKTKFSVSSLFSQIGALSKETNEYRNEARQFRVPPKSTVDKFSPDFTASGGRRIESAFLTIKTKEGDSVTIQLSRNQINAGASKLEFSFVVDGKLSEKEQKAIAQLAEKLGAIGDEFFRMDTAELRGLKDVDTDVITHFNFTVQRPKAETDAYVEHSYEFSVNEASQTQTLKATDVKGYSVDITTALQGLVANNHIDRNVFQQYIDLINKAGDDSDTPNASKRFMLDAFESMFSGLLTAKNKPSENDPDRAELSIAAFDSGLPDFNATFRSPVYHNPNFYEQTASMVLTLEQRTTVEKNGENLLIEQSSNYDFSSSHFEGFPVEHLNYLGGNYTYATEHVTGSVNRFLSMTNDAVNNLWVEQEMSKEVSKTRFENYRVVDEDSYSYSDHNIQQFAELLKKYNGNNQQSSVEELLKSSKDKLFLDVLSSAPLVGGAPDR